MSDLYVKNNQDTDYFNIPNGCGVFINGVEPQVIKTNTKDVWLNNQRVVSGNYSWHQFNPETSYGKYNNSRIVNDFGNTGLSAISNSGRTFTLSGDGLLEIPINFDGSTGAGAVIYYDKSVGKFIQVKGSDINADNFRLENGTFGAIVRLWDTVFNQYQMDYINRIPEILVTWGINIYVTLLPPKNANDWLFCATESQGDTLLEIKEIESLQIQGTYTRNYGDSNGILVNKLVLNQNEVPIESIYYNRVKFNKHEIIETKILPKGSTNSSFMIAFQVNSPDYEILFRGKTNTDNENIRLSKTSQTEFDLKYGSYRRTITFTNMDRVHAIYASYNHNNQEITWAIDGEDFTTDPGTFINDAEAPITIGSSRPDFFTESLNYSGVIGEFIFSDEIITDEEWKDFWNRNLKKPYHMTCSSTLTCGSEVVKCSPEKL